MKMFTFDFRAFLVTAILIVGSIIVCDSTDTNSSDTSQLPTIGDIAHEVVPSCYFEWDQLALLAISWDHPEGIVVNATNITCKALNPEKKVYLLVHGFDASARSKSVLDLAQFLMYTMNQTIFLLDWSKEACAQNATLKTLLSYPKAADNVHDVGCRFGDILVQLSKICKVLPKDIVLVGHSLGAHVVGIGAEHYLAITGQKIGLIIACDPAAPLFSFGSCDTRLCIRDAIYVVVIITSPLGSMDKIGNTTIVFNNGLNQPGCGLDIACSHSRGLEYLKYSLTPDCMFIARPKGFFGLLTISVSQCTTDTCIPVGFDIEKYPARGDFSATTSDSPPYCIDHPPSNFKIL